MADNPHARLPLSPAVFHILLALAGEKRHGYAIMQEVERHTGGAMRLGPGTLYGAIKRLRDSGLIEEIPEPADAEGTDERRRTYRLTPLGRATATAEAERMARLVNSARAKQLISHTATS